VVEEEEEGTRHAQSQITLSLSAFFLSRVSLTAMERIEGCGKRRRRRRRSGRRKVKNGCAVVW
jgi:hypothetical protein